jgi:hypothetical protein
MITSVECDLGLVATGGGIVPHEADRVPVRGVRGRIGVKYACIDIRLFSTT